MSATKKPMLGQIKEKLIQQSLEKRLSAIGTERPKAAPAGKIPEAHWRFDQQPGYRQVELIRQGAQRLGASSPFFHVHEGIAGARTHIAGHSLLNFANYNYLDLSGHPAVQQAAKEAIDRYGSSVSASRIVAGERPLHRDLEQGLARWYGVEDALVLVSGHATNVGVIGHLLGPRDLILHDAYAHNSIVLGAQLSGAQRLSFPHNDVGALEELLSQHRHRAERTLIVVEGLYSMDGDFPNLPALIELKNRFQTWLMVDEAHSLGVLGRNGHGIAEHFTVNPRQVDIWMGTLSKTLASCGGFVAGEQALIDNLRYLAPTFLYSVGLAPPLAAAALAALQILQDEPERVQRLQENGQYFLEHARAVGLDTGSSAGFAISPVILGSSLRCVRAAEALMQRGVHVQPILYPAVPEKQARLRFFLSSAHTQQDIDQSIHETQEVLNKVL